MNYKETLINSSHKLHTTILGEERIKNNLKLSNKNVVEFCKKLIIKDDCIVIKKDKNYYCKNKSIVLTVNANSYTIITAHLK